MLGEVRVRGTEEQLKSSMTNVHGTTNKYPASAAAASGPIIMKKCNGLFTYERCNPGRTCPFEHPKYAQGRCLIRGRRTHFAKDCTRPRPQDNPKAR
eukprot:12938893-Prorocentrum_lima.AAC.1